MHLCTVPKRLQRASVISLSLMLGVVSAVAQRQTPTQVASASGFIPGGEELFALDFTRAPIGSFPSAIRRLSGTMEVVSKDGTRMLRASEVSEFLITLPRALPQNFTIEVDIVPKECCPPPDLSLEGTARINQGSASAHLLWTADANFGWVGIVGGAVDNREFQMPDEVRATLPGSLAKVGVSVEGGTIKLYTNGRQLYAVPAQFVRGSVLRVTLGGTKDDEGTKPVYLARVRVATGAPVAVATALPATMTGTIAPMSGARGTATQSQASTATTGITGLSVTRDAAGHATLKWDAVSDASAYAVVRWNVNDLTCCNNVSPPGGTSGSSWLDGVLPREGTYAYRVYATTAAGTIAGETQVTFKDGAITSTSSITSAGSGTIASPEPPPATPPPTTSGEISGMNRASSTTVMSSAPVPIITTPIAGTPGVAELRWTTPTGAVNYEVWRRVGANSAENLTATPVTQPAYRDALSNLNTTYEYQVVAYQANGTYGRSEWVAFPPPPLVNPTGFAVRQNGAGEVMLTWQQVAGATGYRIDGSGVANIGARATGEYLSVQGLPTGTRLSWQVAALYGENVFDAASRPTTSITLSPTPWRSVPWISMRNGAGSLIDEIAYYSEQKTSGAIPDCGAAYPWECMHPVNMIMNFGVDGAFLTRLGDKSTRTGRPVFDVAFADIRDMAAGRHVYCSDAGIAPAAETLCWASTHGPRPGTPGWGDPSIALGAVADAPTGWTFIRQGARGTLFAAFDVGSTASGAYGSDQYGHAKAETVLDAEGPKRLPHACLACHGGRFDPATRKVVETSLIPLDPGALVFSSTGSGPDAQQEESIRLINMVVLNSNPSPAVADYIRGLYGGNPEVAGTRANVNYIPPGWTGAAELYKKIVKPYCQGCHLQQQPRIDFATQENFLLYKAAIQTSVCTTRTMPHAEAPFKAMWRDGSGASLPDYLMGALGLGKCAP